MIKLKMTGKAGTIEVESKAVQLLDINGQPTIKDDISKYDIAYIYDQMAKTDGVENDNPKIEEENER